MLKWILIATATEKRVYEKQCEKVVFKEEKVAQVSCFK